MTELEEEIVRMHVDEGMNFREISRQLNGELDHHQVRAVIRDKAKVPVEVSKEILKIGLTKKFVCKWCEREEQIPLDDPRTYCSRPCHAADTKYNTIFNKGPNLFKHPDGHWVIDHPFTKKTTSLERFLVQMKLGRELQSTEWVSRVPELARIVDDLHIKVTNSAT